MTRHSALFTHLLFSLPLAGGLLCAAPAALAQSTNVTIPFSFTANNHGAPAGAYRINLSSDRFLTLYNVKTSKSLVLMVRPESGQVMESQSRLTFHSAGGQYYLAQLWLAGSSMHSETVTHPKPSKEYARAIRPEPQTYEIAFK